MNAGSSSAASTATTAAMLTLYTADRRPDRVERLRDADDGAEPEPRQPVGLREGAADDDVWEAVASSGMKVCPRRSRRRLRRRTRWRPAGSRRAIVLDVGRATPRCPSGCSGSSRRRCAFAAVMAASTSSSGKLKSGRGATRTVRPPATAASNFEDLERRLRHDRFRHTAPVRRPQSGDGSGHDAFVEPVGQRQP